MKHKVMKGGLKDHVRFIEETMKSGYTDLKGALFFLQQEYEPSKEEMKAATIQYCKKHNIPLKV